MNYLRALDLVHRQKKPRSYLEIGVRLGNSLSLSRCYSVGVDPGYEIRAELRCDLRLYRMPSDDFFATQVQSCMPEGGFDLIFIDGMHLFEYVLRDFTNSESVLAPGGLILIDDIFPLDTQMATRDKRTLPTDRTTRAWTGDVWKLLPTLQKHRPDLRLVGFDCGPTGLLGVSACDPANTTLKARYAEILADPDNAADRLPPAHIIERRDTSPVPQALRALLGRQESA